MTRNESITAERLRELLSYNIETGRFIWKTRPIRPDHKRADTLWNHRYAGTVAGFLNDKGYWRIKIDGLAYLQHRLVWLWTTGEWPKMHIDHRDTDRSNSNICNLRCATRIQNGQNRRKNRNNSSGFKGVSWNREEKKYSANITISKKRKFLGYFSTPEAAHARYIEEANKYFGEFANAG